MARPTKLSPEVEAKLIEAILVGMPYELAADYAGIGVRTFDSWRKRGEQHPHSEYGEFLRHLKGAVAVAAFTWLKAMDGLPQQWQALAWKLERRFPDTFALKKDNTPSSPINVVLGQPNDQRAADL